MPIPTPITLDEVSKRINAICEGHLKRCVEAQKAYHAELEELEKDVSGSPDIDQNAVGSVVLGRIQTMISEIATAVDSI